MSLRTARETDPATQAHPGILARKEDAAGTNVCVGNGRHEICPRAELGVEQPALDGRQNTEIPISRIPREEVIYHTPDRE